MAFNLSTMRSCRVHTNRVARTQAIRPCASSHQSNTSPIDQSRNVLLASLSAAAVLTTGAPAYADYTVFYGMASPPTSYGGYGGNAKESPKYSFEYPEEWKSEVPSKVEKGTQGIDGRVVNQRDRKQTRAFVITLGRAGEDNKSFRLTDLDSTFQGFAGADYDLLDALTNATNVTRTEREIEGVKFFDYDIDSPDFHYLSSISVKGGKVFALFVRAPAKTFGKSETDLRHIIDTFRLL